MWLICLAFGGSKTHNSGSWLRCVKGFGIWIENTAPLQQPWKAYYLGLWDTVERDLKQSAALEGLYLELVLDWCWIDALGWLCQERVLIPPQQSCTSLVKGSRSERLIKGFNQSNWSTCVPFLLLHILVKKFKMHEYSSACLSLCNQGEQGCGFG